MIAKLVVHGVDREHARRRMLRALDEFVVEGVRTLIGFHKALLTHPCFVEGETCHGLVESELMAARAAELENGRPAGVPEPGRAAVRESRPVGRGGRTPVRGAAASPRTAYAELAGAVASARAAAEQAAQARTRSSARCRARCSRSRSRRATRCEAGQVLCIVEAMKMENEVHAHRAGRVSPSCRSHPASRSRRAR